MSSDISRRGVVSAVAMTGIAGLAGCADELSNAGTTVNGGDDEEGGNGGNGENEGAGNGEGDEEENCRMETTTEEENLVDEIQSASAGDQLTHRIDLEGGEEVEVNTRMLDGARPTLIIENPSGQTIAEIGPREDISRTFTAEEEGRYYVFLENEALLTSGEWDTTIGVSEEVEEEVCD